MQNQGDYFNLLTRFSALEVMVGKQEELILGLTQSNNLLSESNRAKDIIIECQKIQLAQFRRLIYGSKHERFESLIPGQLNLGMDMEQFAAAPAQEKTITYKAQAKSKPANHPVRLPIPADIPRKIINIEPEQDATGLKLIGHEITEVLEIKEAEFFVNQYRRPKYAMPQNEGVIIGKLPELPLPKAIAGPSVLSHILINKYVDHLPLYRQIKRFERSGMVISDSTINDWVSGSINVLLVLHSKIIEQIKSSGYIQNDETPIRVLDSTKKGQTHRGFFWVCHSPHQKLVVFEYDKSRSSQYPKEFLKDYQGYLQTDGYAVYDEFSKMQGITMMGCMAHVRRYFEQALNNDKTRSAYVLEQIQLLYAIEREIRELELTEVQIIEKRTTEALPVLNQLYIWFKENITQVTPQSTIGKAIAYALPRWEKMKVYVNDVKLQIDNNLIENQIRPVAIGRKNYLFCGSHESAQRAAVIYSLIACCKLNNINPATWLTDVLTKLPSLNVNEVEHLLPHNWNPDALGVL
ncbi:MAG TPA: IS66 family transposase [Chitinophagaceae bacterium]|nr:IS66 family transposase [Chitinophagaceae bacterium]